MVVVCFLIGCIVWTFMEYVLHRFLGHEHKGKNFFKYEHQRHHSIANYFAPPIKKIFAASIFALVITIVLNLLMPLHYAIAFIAGLMVMYVFYESTHYRYHYLPPIIKPFIILRKHHFYHHFHNPKKNHGVTTRIWDRVFGTFESVEKVNIPKQMP